MKNIFVVILISLAGFSVAKLLKNDLGPFEGKKSRVLSWETKPKKIKHKERQLFMLPKKSKILKKKPSKMTSIQKNVMKKLKEEKRGKSFTVPRSHIRKMRRSN